MQDSPPRQTLERSLAVLVRHEPWECAGARLQGMPPWILSDRALRLCGAQNAKSGAEISLHIERALSGNGEVPV